MHDPATTMAAIAEKTRLIEPIILRQRRRHRLRQTGGSYNEACGLARLQHERRQLQARLPALRLVQGDLAGQ
jgi:hypothetical protein